jgi:hypothetical protein
VPREAVGTAEPPAVVADGVVPVGSPRQATHTAAQPRTAIALLLNVCIRKLLVQRQN